MADTDASVWQRAELIGGVSDEVERLVNLLSGNLHIGHGVGKDKPEPSPARPARSGIDGYLEDRYDELCGIRGTLQSLVGYVGQSGEGPRGELGTALPPVQEVRRW